MACHLPALLSMRWARRYVERAPCYDRSVVVLKDYDTAAVVFVIEGRSRWSYFQMIDVLPLPRLQPCSHVWRVCASGHVASLSAIK
jgi:hypothetical protein